MHPKILCALAWGRRLFSTRQNLFHRRGVEEKPNVMVLNISVVNFPVYPISNLNYSGYVCLLKVNTLFS